MMTLRNVRENEFDDLMALWQFAFQIQMPPERVEKERESFRADNHWGLFDENGRLLTNLSILPLEVWIHGVRMKMGGVASVSSWPDARRQGGVTKLLHHALRKMREAGQTISMLHPFSVPFYRKYGYELTVTRKQYTIETKHFPPRADVPGTVAIVPKRSELLNDVYEQYAAKYSCTLARTDDWWERKVLSKPGVAALYRNPDGIAEGYLLYEAADRKMRIHEWVHTTETARAALWSFIGNHDSMIDQLVMMARRTMTCLSCCRSRGSSKSCCLISCRVSWMWSGSSSRIPLRLPSGRMYWRSG
ncbi:GNAT family N-acetyltransferase [Cohnella faecalis]|uniref:GNAT family N-acetyltransferase n=1 Tax=Cohnella faecalis TaxID=2315694 RepID=A0A398CAK5_9BACL|nr:GNAT family N-acetyltransferase [Cohnella faecalis]RIE00176.1 GNAT family N-acetyltransferase [Cohnella faecalis]